METTTLEAPRRAVAEAEAFDAYRRTRIAHWDAVAARLDGWRGLGGAYHRRLTDVYSNLVPPGQRVLQIGCGEGNLLASLQPAVGVGIDFSPRMIERARRLHPALRFIEADAHVLELDEVFDVVILSDVVNDLWDVQRVFEQVARLSKPRTRVIVNAYSKLWELPLRAAQRLRLAKPTLYQNWLTREDVRGLLALAGFDLVRSWEEVLLPLPIPLLGPFADRVLVRLWPLRYLALTNMIVARPVPRPTAEPEPIVSVVVPARNEAGNIAHIFARTPELGGGTELIFVEGGSTDDTYAAIERAIAEHPHRRAQLFRQSGRGKGDAVRLGFARASGDVLMVLDADLTVPPEDLPRFYDALQSGKGEFINGVRLVYPMEAQAMRFANLIANKFFGAAFSWLLGQPIKDTLCGTKVIRRQDYEQIAANRWYFGDFDPFGDFDLIFGAARLNRKLVDLPVRYRARTYGTTNIQRWRHGVLLFQMLAFAARRLKFV